MNVLTLRESIIIMHAAFFQNVNTCPVDRQEFTLILVRRRVGGKVVRQITVERSEAKDSEETEDPTYCEICGNCDREDRMLLCDGCDLGYHMECLDPPLSHVPVDNWYCSECDHNTSANSNGAIAEAVGKVILFLLLQSLILLAEILLYHGFEITYRWTLALTRFGSC